MERERNCGREFYCGHDCLDRSRNFTLYGASCTAFACDRDNNGHERRGQFKIRKRQRHDHVLGHEFHFSVAGKRWTGSVADIHGVVVRTCGLVARVGRKWNRGREFGGRNDRAQRRELGNLHRSDGFAGHESGDDSRERQPAASGRAGDSFGECHDHERRNRGRGAINCDTWNRATGDVFCKCRQHFGRERDVVRLWSTERKHDCRPSLRARRESVRRSGGAKLR